jgi:hypothetical protein
MFAIRADRRDGDEIHARERARAGEQADQDELRLMPQAASQPRVGAIPGDGAGPGEAGPLQGTQGVVEALTVDHHEGHPVRS